MRTFIAVDLGAEARKAVAGLIRRTAQVVSNVRWVGTDNIHVTLRFLGETAPEASALVENALRDVAAVFSPFKATLSGLGAFPSLKRPRVLWVGIEEGRDELRRIHSALEGGLAREGIPPEGRSYTPHVTIGRLRRPAPGRELLAFARSARLEAGFMVDRLSYIESRLTPKGAVYGTISEAHLSGSISSAGNAKDCNPIKH